MIIYIYVCYVCTCICVVKGKFYGVPAVETADQLYNRHIDPLGQHLWGFVSACVICYP